MDKIDWSKAPHWADRVIKGGALNLLYWASDNTLQPVTEGGASFVTHTHIRNGLPVVERRPVPQTIKMRATIAKTTPLVTLNQSCNAEPAPVTIEQRIASLRALEKQVEETRAELTRDLETLGLTWTMQGEPEQPIITDWSDLRVGDVVEHVKYNGGSLKTGSQGFVLKLKDWRILVNYPGHHEYIYSCPDNQDKFRFIRRP